MRLLAKEQYALYTVVTAATIAMLGIGSSSFSAAIYNRAGRRLSDRGFITGLIQETTRIRRWVIAGSMLVGIPVLATLLHRTGATTSEVVVLCCILGTQLAFQTQLGLRQVVLLLYRRANLVQRIQIQAGIIRLVALLPILIAPSRAAIIAAAGTLAATMWTTWRIGRPVEVSLPRRTGASLRIDPDRAGHRAEVLLRLRQTLPVSVFVVLQGQLWVVVLASMGDTDSVAELGAISRYTLIFAFVAQIGTALLVPSFARQANTPRLLNTYARLVGASAFLYGIALTALLVASEPLLTLLGPEYDHLKVEFALINLGAALAAFAETISGFNRARGWTKWSWLYIPVSLAWNALLLTLLNLEEIRSAAILNAAAFVPGLTTNLARAAGGLTASRHPPDSSATVKLGGHRT